MAIRNFRWGDLPALADLDNRLLASPHAAPGPTRRFMREFLGQPNLNPEADLFLYESDDYESNDYECDRALAGYGLIFWEPAISRAVLMLKTRPGVDGPSVEEALVERALRRAAELGSAVLQAQTAADSSQARLLARRGFAHVRTYWNMRWDIQEPPEAPPPSGHSFRGYGQDGDAEALTEIQNAAFGGSWGFSPNTPREIAYRADMSVTSHDGIIFLTDGPTVLGYCWTYMMADAETTAGVIFMIGIHPQYRRRRLGRPLLAAGLRYLIDRGVNHVELEVDGANVPATRLYFSLGFRKVAESHWFEADPSAPSSP